MKTALLSLGLLSLQLLYGQTPTITRVADSAAGGSALAPGDLARVFGTNLGNSTSIAVTVDGKPAAVLQATPAQLAIQIPASASLGSVPVVVGSSTPFSITLTQYAPVLFSADGSATGMVQATHSSGGPVTAGAPALPNETISLFAIGLGPTNPVVPDGAKAPSSPLAQTTQLPTVSLGGQGVTASFAGLAPNQIGVYQINFSVRADAQAGNPNITISIGGATSPALTLPVGGSAGSNAPVIKSVTDLSGGTKLSPGGQAIIAGSNLGTNPPVTVGGKNAYNLVAPSTTNGTSMIIEIPVDAALGSATVVVTTGAGGASQPFPITLTQYAPVLPPSGPGSNLAQAYHLASQSPVTASAPASPNEQIAIIAVGLGPTSPQLATGANGSNNPTANTTTLPTVSLGGKPATGISAYATPGQIATYLVVFNVPAGLTAGNASVTVSIGGATSNSLNIPVSTAPFISSVVNAASNIVPGLPNSGIAQGAIFLVFGGLLGPSNIAIAPNAFQSTTLSGTSIKVAFGGTTVDALMYYTSAGQVAALLPSNTPTGTGAITVTYNGQTSPPAPITVVPNNLGIFTVTSDGVGAGIVTYADYSLVSASKAANCGGPSTTCGAANPGDTLILWATGLGPVSGSDAAGAGLGVNQTNVPLKLWLGGVQATVLYQGRSGCCIGEDQIVFTVPANVPTGCAVPLAIQINDQISNNVAMPVAAGSRTCTPTNTALGTAANVPIVGTVPLNYGSIELHRNDVPGGFQDTVKATFAQITFPQAYQPFIVSYVDAPPLGTCTAISSLNTGTNPPVASQAALNPGTPMIVKGPNGTANIAGGGGSFNGTLSPNGSYLAPGAYTVSLPGGADIPAFTANLTIPSLPTMTSPVPDTGNVPSVIRSSGLTVNWTGGSPTALVQVNGSSATDNNFTKGASFRCSSLASAGSLVIPPYILLAMPAGNFGGVDFQTGPFPPGFTAAGLTLGSISAQYDYFASLNFK
jgi:uncharacterized protein (TIGR03437 family)